MPSLKFSAAVIAAVCLAPFASSAPAAGLELLPATATAPYASESTNQVLWSESEDIAPQPIRGTLGATILGPQNLAADLQNPDLLAPPSTDAGTV